MVKLKRVTDNNPYPNYCDDNIMIPVVGSYYCRKNCPFFKGELKILFWKFIKCKPKRHEDYFFR